MCVGCIERFEARYYWGIPARCRPWDLMGRVARESGSESVDREGPHAVEQAT
jgi:hypothetical protein